jgi:hypothetical protein
LHIDEPFNQWIESTQLFAPRLGKLSSFASSCSVVYLFLVRIGAVKFWFWFLWTIDAVVAVVALYFFFSLAANGRVGSFNILPWLAILAALAAVVAGSVWLRSAGQHVVAIVVLLALAIPAVLCLLLFLLLLILHPSFH